MPPSPVASASAMAMGGPGAYAVGVGCSSATGSGWATGSASGGVTGPGPGVIAGGTAAMGATADDAAAAIGGADCGLDADDEGVGSRLVASFTSVAALRNSRMLLPSAEPTSGSRPGPTTISAITRMMMSSGAPIPLMNGISRQFLVRDLALLKAGSKGVRVTQRAVGPSHGRPPRGARRGPPTAPPVGPRG